MTAGTVRQPTLAELSDEKRYERFDRLQERMRAVWEIMRRSEEDESVVVIPSLNVDIGELNGSLQQAYEERFLVLLLLLRQPRRRIIYVTSLPIAPKIVEYYLALLTGVVPSHARARLSLISVGDASLRPHSEKLLERPRLISLIRSLVRDLAITLGIPMFAADPRCFALGTKSGGRELFADLGVRHPLGFENLRSIEDVDGALMRLRAARPDVTQALVKLNDGASGEGNAVVDLRDLPVAGSAGERDEITRRAREMAFGLPGTAFASYAAKLAERGGIVEERISGVELRSPSVQLTITPFGEVELLSTHDQVLGGPGGQSYLGCSFPADAAYATQISAEAQRIGDRLASEGVLGRFAVDFVVVRSGDGSWTPYAIELNLRKGGTTHPFLTLQFLTNGRYDPDTAQFFTPSSREKHLIATDHLESSKFRGLTLDDLFDIVARHGLHFDPARQQGIVFHMISCLTELGRIGLTAVGDTPASAKAMYQKAERILLDEARESLTERPLLEETHREL